MRVVALGGCGDMGRHAVDTLSRDPAITQIVIADLAADAAARAASAYGPQVESTAIDVGDEAALSALLSGADVVMNTVGPFFRFGVPILRAAIATRCHYVDICDDWEPMRFFARFAPLREPRPAAVDDLCFCTDSWSENPSDPAP